MQKIDDYTALSARISGQMKRGLCTNAFFPRDVWEREIAAGRLFSEDWPGGLAVVTAREGYDRLSFWLTEPEAPIPITLRRPTVLEIAARPKDTALLAAGSAWERYGFAPLLSRIRLARGVWEAPEVPVDFASPGDFPAISQLLRDTFHPMGGCIPTPEELLHELSEGRFLCVRDDRGIPAGLLHFHTERRAAKIQHLAVRPELRRQGCARALLAAFGHVTGGVRSVVWTQADNAPAIAFYKACGFAADGWAARVWLYKKEEESL